ncbi:unnamed protein product [Onchocerca ochengi]|uniref:Neuropeptide-Like Protein n=1 Tax=Onchocerca ochengi TaxID=42157 RepID=A0A182EAJ7_ONCOC|nr:unnamed protein product [Onchocerca ochengi]
MSGNREGMLIITFTILFCVVTQYSVAATIRYGKFYHPYPAILQQYKSEPPQSAKRTRDYDFIRFGRSGRSGQDNEYDYIRFGKRFPGSWVNQKFG